MSFDLDLDLDLGLTIYHDSNLSNHDEIYVIAYHHEIQVEVSWESVMSQSRRQESVKSVKDFFNSKVSQGYLRF